jgi:protein-tyrosine-phosphatase
MTHILFVCTGNIFRSLSAHKVLQSVLQADSGITVSSAGTRGYPERTIPAEVTGRLGDYGLDVSAHQSRRLTRQVLDSADLVVAMNTDHQEFIKKHFGMDVPLYMEITCGRPEEFLDLPDVIPDYRTNPEASRVFIHQAIDRIYGYKDAFLKNLPNFLPKAMPVPAAMPAPAP